MREPTPNPRKTALSRSRGQGPSSPSWTPGARRRSQWRGHAPVVAVLLASAQTHRKADERISAPKAPARPHPKRAAKGHARCGSTSRGREKALSRLLPQRARTPDRAAFPLQAGRFKGPPEGAMITVVDPQASQRRDGRMPCHVVAVLLASANPTERISWRQASRVHKLRFGLRAERLGVMGIDHTRAS
jgi:hypothetical protein